MSEIRSLWTPLDASHILDPFPMYRELRKDPHPYRASTGEWIVTRYPELRSILKDKRFSVGNKKKWIDKGIHYFQSIERDFSTITTAINSFILLIDPPRHTVLRKFIAEVWDDREVDHVIEENIRELLDTHPEGVEMDFIADYARPLPAMTIAAILGIPLKDHKMLQDWGFDLVKALDLYNKIEDLVKMEGAASELVNYFRNHVQDVSSRGNGGLIRRIIERNKLTDTLETDEIVSICILLMVAGQETTVGLIGTGLWHLGKHPAERMKMHDNIDLIDSGIEELLRFDGPVHMLGRIAGEDLMVGDQKIRQGETLTLCLASANRDEQQFEYPDQLMVDRRPNPHLAFGAGIHRCMGDWLATRQSKMAIQSVLRRFPAYCIEEESPHWNSNISIRTLKSLRVSVG